MAEVLSRTEMETMIKQQYPSLAAYLSQPGVEDAIYAAVQGGYFTDSNGNPTDRFQAALEATPWYRATTAADRNWVILGYVDPATAADRRTQYQMQLESAIHETGVNLDPATYDKFLNQAAANQWSAGQLKMNLVWQAGNLAGTHITGEMQNNVTQVDALASDYGVPVSTQTGIDWASKLTAGSVDTNAVKGYMIEQAKSLYPSLSAAIDSGITVKQYTDPYAQIAARELNMNPNDFNLQNTKWSAPLQQIDPKTGQRTAMSLDQWQTTLRTDPKYGFDQTLGAKAQAAGLEQQLGQMMGVA